MIYLALGCAVLAALLWLGRGRPTLGDRGWRIGAGVLALAAFAAAAFLGLRGGWGKAIVLVVLGLGLLTLARRPAARSPSNEEMSLSQACSLLGVGPEATRREVQAAYLRLMQRAHPDHGGTSGLAAQLNAARARLLRQAK